jgi:hypothetical protein
MNTGKPDFFPLKEDFYTPRAAAKPKLTRTPDAF